MGCTGACCAAFPLSRPLENLERCEDGEYIAAMVRPITIDEAGARLSATGSPVEPNPENQYYRCVHWDEQSRRCREYDRRPGMCSRYPYGRSCDHGCDCRGISLEGAGP